MSKILQRKEYLIISVFVLIKLVIHFITNMNAGLDGDEIMHIDTGRHLAWGYMSIQPLVGFFGWIQNLFNSNSVFVHHLFSHISAVLIIIFSGFTVIKLGGTWKAILVTLTCILVAPGFALSQHTFAPFVFDQLFWLLSFYMLIAFCKDQKNIQLILLAVFLALGFMPKLTIVFLIGGFGISILFYRRDLFAKKISWLAVVVFMLIISPNIFWQYNHGFPLVQHMLALQSKTLANFAIADNITLLLLTTNPATIVVWFIALFIAPFIAFTKDIRLAIVALFIAFITMVISRGQFSYFYPIIIIALCVGSVIIENYLNPRIFLVWIYVAILIISGVFLVPKVLPILPLEKYIQNNNLVNSKEESEQWFLTQQTIVDNKEANKDERIPIMYEAYYTHNDWLNLTETLNEIYQQLPQEKQNNCYIWTRCYTQAGGINMHGKKYNLPEAFSQHGNCYEWIPQFDASATIIVVANAESPADSVGIGSFFAPLFEKLYWKDAIFCPYARTSSNAYYMLYLGEGLKYDSDELKLKYKDYIFE